MLRKIISFFKKEVVFSAALVLAILSACIVPPGRKYISYIDYNTLFMLFSLMCVMAGFQKIGVFKKSGEKLLSKVSTIRGILFVLVFMPFLLSMFITNDVALITFVPFAVIVLSMAGLEHLFINTVILQTLAANLGSMMLPMGNPQNLYLFNKAGLSPVEFILIMLPYTAASAFLLMISILTIKNDSVKVELNQSKEKINLTKSILYTFCFIICLLSVAKLIPPFLTALIIFGIFIISDRKVLLSIDYCLLATFIAFFIFVGNIKNIEIFNSHIALVVENHETLCSVILSQIISNVPAALLLSGFTDNLKLLIIGTNLGGLGTLIASMASLISYKLLCGQRTELKGKYVIRFSVFNIVYLVILYVLFILLNR